MQMLTFIISSQHQPTKLQTAREASLNKKLEKLTPVQDFEDCCNK
jgi:hypothetical protein